MKKRILKTIVSIFFGGALMLGIYSFSKTDNYFEIAKNMDIFSTLYKELNTYYVDDIQPGTIMKTGIDAMLESLDPYTSYISETEMDEFRFQTTGKYGGIGAIIGKIGEYIVIMEPYENGPAQKGGLLAGDKIISVDDVSLKSKNSDEVSKALKGQPNTLVAIKVFRMGSDGTEKELLFKFNREEIHVSSVSYYGMINNDIAYIQLEHFTLGAAKEVKEAIELLEAKNKVKGIVLDLRENPGGLLNEAIDVSNIFVEKGEEIVSTKGKVEEWDKVYKSINNAVDKETPLLVLTNSGSASASEIVAGSIQDLDRGIVLGQRTYGKGLVQTTRPLSYNTKLKVTTAKYYIPSGRCIQAINYAEKGPNGEVKKIPDSLKTAFKTKSGRTVYDGGGIDPDVKMEPEYLSQISVSLLTKNIIFGFATQYRAKHKNIAPIGEFKLTDVDFDDFVKYIADKDYIYSTQSEKLIDQLRKEAEEENYLDAIKEDLSILKKKIDSDKQKDVFKQKEEIMGLLLEEIAEKYYYKKGRIVASFNHDTELKKGIEIIRNSEQYKALLNPAKQ